MPCKCSYCKNNLDFILPKEIINATISGNLVVFAGAGISTENKNVFQKTLYEEIKDELKLSKENLDFPTLMSKYCRQVNGRQRLLQKIAYRFEYVHQFSELYKVSSWFHHELSSNYLIDKIVTTNWDDYFERECGATPIVTAEDFVFYNLTGRKVFKIHGSISNYGSVVATTEDYNKCYNNLKTGLIGSHLKSLLATKVVVFVGFSFSDFDFNKIYDYLKREMKNVIPHCYIVTINKNFQKNLFDKHQATVINTDGKYFFSVLREHLEGKKYLLPKKNLDTVEMNAYQLSFEHKISKELFFNYKKPSSIYNLFYQDGLKHAFDFILFHSKSGKSFNPSFMLSSIESYKREKRRFLGVKNYPTYSYRIFNRIALYFFKAKQKQVFAILLLIGCRSN